MPRSKSRMLYTLSEVFGAAPVDQDEIELERTNGPPSDPNWQSSVKRFHIGLSNARDTVLSNMIAKKTTGAALTLSEFLDFLHTSQSRLFDFIVRIIDRLVSSIGPKEK